MISLNIDYKKNSTYLCELGKKYDTDKSSQRNNISDSRYSHPYTILYDSLFKNKQNENIKIAELGILHGSSLLMWKEYFKNGLIYGFDNNDEFIINFKKNYNNERIFLNKLNIKNKNDINDIFNNLNILFDIIIDDTTHEFEDQIRIIENTYQYLKPGGLLIIEDIFLKYNEQYYIDRLKPILDQHFQDYFFIQLDHINRNSTGWDNDKLFILIRNGNENLFKNSNKLTIITPSYRIDNLIEIKKSINFDYIDEWIIVYDGNKIYNNPLLFKNNDKIKEYIYKCPNNGISGNPQRNYALTKINNPNTLLYYLDDDNIMHQDIYKLLNIIDNDKMYTFDQYNKIKGNNINIGYIDTAMTIIPYNLCKDIKWILDKYDADGYYIKECYEKNKDFHVYVNNDLCFYNFI